MFIATATQPVERVCQLSDRPTPAILLPSILSRAWTQEPASQPSGWRGRWWWRRFGMQSPWPQTSENHETLFGYTTHPVNCCRPTPSRRVISHRANDPPFISFRGWVPPTDTPSIQHNYESACNLNLIIPPLSMTRMCVVREKKKKNNVLFVAYFDRSRIG